jgi:hypothetical protein
VDVDLEGGLAAIPRRFASALPYGHLEPVRIAAAAAAVVVQRAASLKKKRRRAKPRGAPDSGN